MATAQDVELKITMRCRNSIDRPPKEEKRKRLDPGTLNRDWQLLSIRFLIIAQKLVMFLHDYMKRERLDPRTMNWVWGLTQASLANHHQVEGEPFLDCPPINTIMIWISWSTSYCQPLLRTSSSWFENHESPSNLCGQLRDADPVDPFHPLGLGGGRGTLSTMHLSTTTPWSIYFCLYQYLYNIGIYSN